MRTLGMACLFIFLSLGGCLQDDDPAPEPAPPAEAPEREPEAWHIDWFPLDPVAGDTVLLEAPENATQVVWIIGSQRYEGRTVRVDLPVGSHEVTVRYHDGVAFQTHQTTIEVAAAPVAPREAPDAPEAPPATPGPGTPLIDFVQDRNQLTFGFDWGATPARVDWFFGDGTTSNAIEPAHAYGAPGTYTVRAVAWLAQSRYTPEPIQVTIEDVPLTFTVERNGAAVEVTAQWDLEDADFAWDFGDGGIGSGQEAAHVYAHAGPFTITVQAVAGGDAEVASQTILLDDFPLTIEHELDANIASFAATWGFEANHTWYFGDGQRSHDEAPSHRYPAVGTYTVTLQVRAGEHVAAESFELEITQMKLAIDATVDLNNLTAGATWDLPADNFTWDLDTDPAYGEDVSHDYSEIGPRTLVLTATSGPHIERVTLPIMIWTMPVVPTVTVPPGNVATFGYTWSHVPDIIRWEFGDDERGSGASPQHTYPGIGTYTAKITVSNPELRAVGIQAVAGEVDVEIKFDGMPQFSCWGEPVHEPTLRFGASDGFAWGAFKQGGRMAIGWSGEAMDVRYFVAGKTVNATLHVDGTHHLALDDGFVLGSKACWRGEIDGEIVAGPHGVLMQNAMNAYDTEAAAYQVNMLYLAGEGQQQRSIEAEIDHFAGKLTDMTDGHLAPGLQLLFHGATAWGASGASTGTGASPCTPGDDGATPACELFDVIFTNNGRPDAAGFANLRGIESPTGSIYVISRGWDANPEEPHVPGNTLTHEFGHYGMGLMDLYIPVVPFYAWLIPLDSNCIDESHDISVMAGGSPASELDDEVHRCPNEESINDYWADPGSPPPFFFGGERYVPSWTQLRDLYPEVPDRTVIAAEAPGPGDRYRSVSLLANP